MIELTALLTVLAVLAAIALVGAGSWRANALARAAETTPRDVTANWPDGLPRP